MSKRAADSSSSSTSAASAESLLFVVGWSSYASDHEDRLLPRSSWWEHAKYRPREMASILNMDEDESLLWRSINSGYHVLISGQAGSGKSNLLGRFSHNCFKANINLEMGAPTGVAAFNIGGETLHRKLHLGLAAEPARVLWNTIQQKQQKYAPTRRFLTETDILVIDEISMVTPDFFVKLDILFRKARQEYDRPFGGVILVMVGDFTQLGPVEKDPTKSEETILDTDVWQSLKYCRIFLNRNYRQNNDREYLRILQEIRQGRPSVETIRAIESRVGADPVITADDSDEEHKTLRLRPMTIYPYRRSVDKQNRTELERLVESGQEKRTFYPNYGITVNQHHTGKINPRDQSTARGILGDKSRLAGMFPIGIIDLCVGAQVVMKCNELIDVGIYNGTMGIVVRIEDKCVYVLFVKDGKLSSEPTPVERHSFYAPVGKTMCIRMSQLPLHLAWAGTIHAVQGLTLDAMCLDASCCFTAGQLYVALSRVRKLEDMSLTGFSLNSLITNPRTVAFEVTALEHFLREQKRRKKARVEVQE